MGWFLWGVTFGWAVCAIFYNSQVHDEKADSAAFIIGFAIGIMALILSVALSIASGAIPVQGIPTPTPTFLGR